MSTHVKPTSISISIVLHTAAKSSFNLSWESTYLYNFRNSYEKLYSDSNYINCSILNAINRAMLSFTILKIVMIVIQNLIKYFPINPWEYLIRQCNKNV